MLPPELQEVSFVLAPTYAVGSVHRLIPQWHERVPEQRAEAGEHLLSRATVPQLLAFKTSNCSIQCCVRAKQQQQQQQQQGHAAALLYLQEHSAAAVSLFHTASSN
jgi:hypothetical protein